MSTQTTERETDGTGTDDRRRRWWVVGAVVAVPVLAVGWWLLEPALFDDRVDTEFPAAIQPVGSADVDEGAGADEDADAASSSGAAVPPQTLMDDERLATDEPAAGSSSSATATSESSAPTADSEGATSPPSESESAEPEPSQPAAPAGPVLLASGSFVGLDNHDATGRAALLELEDGSRVVRLEDLDADNGPELELHVVPGADQTRPGEGTFVAPLQGNQGNQTYELPAGFEVPETATVLIWCVPFSSAIGGATVTPT